MKQLIRIGVLMGLLAATIPLRAQVAPRDLDARKGSRLELGRTPSAPKTSANRLPSQRFSIVPNPSVNGLDRSITFNKNAAINEHYRSLLIANPSSKSAARTVVNDGAGTVANELRSGPAQEGKTENRLFANEKLWVSNAYPNPADDVAEIDYQFAPGVGTEVRLSLMNVLGIPVSGYEQLELDRKDTKVRIVTRSMDTGYYLYQLSIDGKKVATKRLLVRHQ